MRTLPRAFRNRDLFPQTEALVAVWGDAAREGFFMRAVSAFACLLLLFGCEPAHTVTPGVTVPSRSASAVDTTPSAVPVQAPMPLPEVSGSGR